MRTNLDALVIVIGSILFLAGAFAPISLAVFGESDPDERLAIIEADQRAWQVDQIFYALGPIVTAVGAGLAMGRFADQPRSWLAALGVAALAVAAVLWAWHVGLRATDPEAFTAGALPGWMFTAYTLLTQAGLAASGIALLQTSTPRWVGWLLIGAAVVLLIVFLIYRDLPPFIYYVLTLILGVMLYRTG